MIPGFLSISPRKGKGQSVSYTGTAGSLTLPAAGDSTNPDMSGGIWVVVSTNAYVATGGTATTSDMYLPANIPVVLAASPGMTISAIQDTANGTLYVMPLA